MSIRLTESRLRQIIREEMRSLSGRRSLREGAEIKKFYIPTAAPKGIAGMLNSGNSWSFEAAMASIGGTGKGIYACASLESVAAVAGVVEIEVDTSGFIDPGDSTAEMQAVRNPPPGATGVVFMSKHYGAGVVVLDPSALISARALEAGFGRY